MKRLLTPVSPVCLLAAGIVVALAVTPLRAEIVERIIVKVNGEIFTKTDLETRQVTMLREQGQQQKLNDADLKKRVEEITPQLLVDSIDEMLLLQRGKELGYKLSDADFNEILGKLKADNKIESEEQFQAALKQEGLTLAELRKTIERNMIVQRVQQAEVFGHISVTQEEAKKYYDEHRNEFTSVPSVTLREILVKVASDGKNINVGLDEEARQKAATIRERAIKGESFEKLTELSDAPSKSNGGLIGPINRSDLDPSFAKMLATMKPGEVSPVLRTASGYTIVKLESATEAKVLPFEEARQQIGNKIYAAKQQVEFAAYIKRLRASAIIDWKVPELKKVYDDQVARGQVALVAGGSH